MNDTFAVDAAVPALSAVDLSSSAMPCAVSKRSLPQALGHLRFPVIMLAPMAGVTDFPFRQIVRRMGGCSQTIGEMIASQALIRSIAKSIQRSCQQGEHTAVQLAGNDPEVMAQAARICVDHGATLIDINMGCPVKKVAVNSYAGSALMQDEKLAAKIFRAIVKAVPVPVTVKIRKGWDHLHQNALAFTRMAYDEGLAYVTLHGRTRSQLFSGQADWDFIHSVHEHAPLPIVGNGDITTPEQAKHALTRAWGIMVGRGCYGRPWLLQQMHHFVTTNTLLPPPPLWEQKDIVGQHLQALMAYYGIEQGMLIARKHLGWYSKGLPGSSEFRTRVFQENTVQGVLAMVNTFYDRAADIVQENAGKQ